MSGGEALGRRDGQPFSALLAAAFDHVPSFRGRHASAPAVLS